MTESHRFASAAAVAVNSNGLHFGYRSSFAPPIGKLVPAVRMAPLASGAVFHPLNSTPALVRPPVLASTVKVSPSSYEFPSAGAVPSSLPFPL